MLEDDRRVSTTLSPVSLPGEAGEERDRERRWRARLVRTTWDSLRHQFTYEQGKKAPREIWSFAHLHGYTHQTQLKLSLIRGALSNTRRKETNHSINQLVHGLAHSSSNTLARFGDRALTILSLPLTLYLRTRKSLTLSQYQTKAQEAWSSHISILSRCYVYVL